MGNLLRDQGKLAEAEPLFREALVASRSVLGERHPDTLIATNNLANLLQDVGQADAAAPLFYEAL